MLACVYQQLCRGMSMPILFIIAKIEKTSMSSNSHIYTVEYFTGKKRNELYVQEYE